MIKLTIAYVLGLTAFLLMVDFGGLEDVAIQVNQLPVVDKVIHFCMFGFLALLANASLVLGAGWPFVGAIATGSTFALVASTFEEFSNRFVSFRTSSLSDLAANYLGILCLGIVPLVVWHWKQPALKRAN